MVQATNVVIQPFNVSNAYYCTYNITSPNTGYHLGSLIVQKNNNVTHYDGNSGNRLGTETGESRTDTINHTKKYLQKVASNFLVEFPILSSGFPSSKRAGLETEAITTGFTVTIAQEYT